MSPRQRKKRDELDPVVPPGSVATIEARISTLEETLGLSRERVFIINHSSAEAPPGGYSTREPGSGDLIIELWDPEELVEARRRHRASSDVPVPFMARR